jgi:hypothetical protein
LTCWRSFKKGEREGTSCVSQMPGCPYQAGDRRPCDNCKARAAKRMSLGKSVCEADGSRTWVREGVAHPTPPRVRPLGLCGYFDLSGCTMQPMTSTRYLTCHAVLAAPRKTRVAPGLSIQADPHTQLLHPLDHTAPRNRKTMASETSGLA